MVSGESLNQFVGNGCLVPTIFMLLEYGLAIASSTYCLTFFFSDHSAAQNVILLVHFLCGLTLMVVSFIMGLIQATRSLNSVLKLDDVPLLPEFETPPAPKRQKKTVGARGRSTKHGISIADLDTIEEDIDDETLEPSDNNIFRLSPSFCFADGLASLALRRQGIKRGSGIHTLDWNVTGASICYLGIESVVYFLLTIGLEVIPSCRLSSLVSEWWQNFQMNYLGLSQTLREPLVDSSQTDVLLADEDVDVQAERERVASGSVKNAIIYLKNLRKVYPGGRNCSAKVAVNSLSFSVQEGECFGFLGTNGAGKTTTLSMLSGEEYPTDGTAYIFGKDIRLHPEAASQHVGYCPQFDALLEFLTVREHLELYANIKGVPEVKMKDIVNEKLMEFDLWKHADKPSFSLSGGNKRRLSVAIAMIGDPPIVILDEPSTDILIFDGAKLGMDPIAKRFMWEVISRLSTRRGKTAVILTTHSMTEAQALCTRIGIMLNHIVLIIKMQQVAGQLRCIGSPQHLKTRFGNHLELEVKPTEVSTAELSRLCKRIQEILFDFPCHTRGLLSDLEICIGGCDTISSDNISEISLTQEMIILIARCLGHEESIQTLVSSKHGTSSTPVTGGVFGEQLSEQLVRDGGIPLRIFSEWWLATEKFSAIDNFILTSFPGATFHGCNGLSVKYQGFNFLCLKGLLVGGQFCFSFELVKSCFLFNKILVLST
ncbi:hypothetical protein Taro_018782 [Colocasia esculenta]|uniref:ABC transporter domain-containing protein n=1 Tax=Colocasia esculenta TaxID=4460 RepID=A0A843V3H3_COLES|nr:hypothetical protein [Colocasia esculenta]